MTKALVTSPYFNDLSATQRKRWLACERGDWRCWFCGKDMLAAKYDLDVFKQNTKNQPTLQHLVLREMGGTDDIENLICACRACNSNRAGRSLKDYRISLNRQHVKLKTAIAALAEIADSYAPDAAERLKAITAELQGMTDLAQFILFYGEKSQSLSKE